METEKEKEMEIEMEKENQKCKKEVARQRKRDQIDGFRWPHDHVFQPRAFALRIVELW